MKKPDNPTLKENNTVSEVAAWLGKHQRTILNWLNTGRLVGSQPGGGRWIITASAVEKMLEKTRH
jgi:excisionase family DNA binding protein